MYFSKKSIPLLYSLIILFAFFLFSAKINAEDISISVTIFSDTYAGIFTGNTKNNLPSGNGSFTCADDNGFSLDGIWDNGLLQGDANIRYTDGRETKATFENGLIEGEVKEYALDGSYRTFQCINGRPYGFISCYDNNDVMVSWDYFYQMQPVSELKNTSISPDYNLLLNSSADGNVYKITGSVLAVYEDDENAYVLFQDIQHHCYILTYSNGEAETFHQAIVPNLIAGDSITAYGFLQRQSSLSTISKIGLSTLMTYPDDNNAESDLYYANSDTTFPVISLFMAELQNTAPFDRLNPSRNYEDVLRNTYLYYDIECSLTCDVISAHINYNDQNVLMYVAEQQSAETYYVLYEYEEGARLPSVGDTIALEGIYYGNHKSLIEKKLSSDNTTYENILFTSKLYTICPEIYSNKLDFAR